ncbi:MAG: acyltransferase domain-containing protein [Armatimonadota bacterium]
MSSTDCLSAAFDDVMHAAGVPEAPESWRAGWDAAMAAYPGDALWFLTEASFHEANQTCGFPAEACEAYLAAMAGIRTQPALCRLAWLWHSLLFRDEPVSPHGWPLPEGMGPDAAMFPGVVLLSGLPRLLAMHRERGISEEITHATCSDIEIWMRHDFTQNGRWGFQRLGWLVNHFSGQLFRLGRLQFKIIPFNYPVRAFIHRQSGQVVALSEPGVRYRRDGLVDGTDDIFDPEAWEPMLEMDDHAVRGHRITPFGYAQQQPVTLSLAEWQPCLAPGDQVLDMHIPRDGKMDFDACGESLRQALEFFPRHFPELPKAVAFICNTWLFDAQYQDLLPAESNIVRFQREFYLFPLRSDENEPFFRVFGGKPADLHAAPRDSTLQRALLDATLAGRHLHCAGGFALIEGFVWGTERYQGKWESDPVISD